MVTALWEHIRVRWEKVAPAVAILLLLLIADVVVEMFVRGSPDRWLLAGGAVLYGIIVGFTWKKWTWALKGQVSFLVLLLLVTIGFWLSRADPSGITILGRSVVTVVTPVVGILVLLAAADLARLPSIPRWSRIVVWVLGGYALAALVHGIVVGTPFTDLLRGESFWKRVPVWLQGVPLGVLLLLPLGLLALLFGPRTGQVRPRAVQALTMVLVFVMAVATLRAPGTLGAPTRLSYSATEADRELDTLVAVAGQFRQQLPRATFDVDHKAAELRREPDRIFRFVRDEVRLEAYRGSLRGPQGTLMAGAGNPVDKSLLLAALLRASGKNARLARGDLLGDATALLVERVVRSPRPPAPDEPPELDASFRPLLSLIGMSEDEFRSVRSRRLTAIRALDDEIKKRTTDDFRVLRDVLRRQRVHLSRDPASQRAKLVEQFRDHVWVQLETDGAWADLDPSFPDGSAEGKAFAAPTATHQELPEELHQRVTIRVSIERLAGARTNVRQIYEKTDRAYAFLARPLNLAILPENSALFEPERTATVGPLGSISEKTRFQPIISFDNKVEYGSPFDLTGRAYTYQEGSGFVPLGAAGERVRDILARPGTDPGASGPSLAPVLSAVWLDYVVSMPGGATRVYRRDLLDRIGRDRRAAGGTPAIRDVSMSLHTVALRLVRGLDINITVAPLNGPFIVDRQIEWVTRNRELLRSALDLLYKREATTGGGDTKDVFHYPFHLTAFSMLGERLQRSWLQRRYPSVIAYSDQPQIVAYTLGFVGDERRPLVREGFDIVANEGAVLSASRPEDAVGFGLEKGIMETNIELLLGGRILALAKHALPDAQVKESVVNASILFELARSRSIPLVALDRQQEAKLSGLPLPAEVKARLLEEIREGHVVVVPERQVALGGRERVAWWRITPSTANALGVDEHGEGSQAVEKPLLKTVVQVPKMRKAMEVGRAIAYIVSLMACQRESGSRYYACMAMTMANYGVGGIAWGLPGRELGMGLAMVSLWLFGVGFRACRMAGYPCP